MIEPLRLSFEVDCSRDHAFVVWTERIGTWWPSGHSVSAEDDVTVVLEPRRGGRIFERTSAGAEHDWGEITAWEPPSRLAYLWHINRDRADATVVEISFVAVDPSRTRVEIEHSGWERLGADAASWRDRNVDGWSSLVPEYRRAASAYA